MRQSRRAVALIMVLALLVVGCGNQTSGSAGRPGATATRPGKLTSVSFALDWTPNTNHTGIYVAEAKGWYEQQGLKLKILPYSEGTPPELLVANGKADFGISFVENLVIARAKGQDLVSIAAIIPHNTSALVTLKKSGLDRPRDLDGKRYAGFGSPFENAVVSDVIRCDGGKGRFQNITTNLAGYQAVKTGKADFVWIYMGWEGIQAKREGVKLNVFYINKYCVPDYPSPVIITSGRMIREHPDVVRRFMAATAKGYTYAIEHPREAADLLIKNSPPDTFPDKGLVYESQKWLSPRYMDRRVQKEWGEQTARMWTGYPKLMYRTGKIQNAENKTVRKMPDVHQYYTNRFLP